MNKKFLIVLISLLGCLDLLSYTLAQSINLKLSTTSTFLAKTPSFKDYPVKDIYKGKPAPVDLSSHPEARKFRDRLRYGAKQGPNFAGHFTVVEWGCGSPCQNFAIVNAKTGKVYMSNIATSFGTKYQLNSNLLILDPDIPPETNGIYGKTTYYVWKNGKLRKL